MCLNLEIFPELLKFSTQDVGFFWDGGGRKAQQGWDVQSHRSGPEDTGKAGWGLWGGAGEADSHKPGGSSEGGHTGSVEAESGRAEWMGSCAGGPALLHKRRSGSTWRGEGDAQDQ